MPSTFVRSLSICAGLGLVMTACSSTHSSSNPPSSSPTGAPAALTGGSWPTVGTVCESGSGGGATARGVTASTIDIATFADPGNTYTPGLNKEFFQVADAFAAWCNAAGGINGRKIVVHTRDAALFNAGQVTAAACQEDFMSVGGGLVIDQGAVPVRVGCGLGQIPAYLVSNAADVAALQVDPLGTRVDETQAGWYSALSARYPTAIQHFGLGAANNPSILEAVKKWEQAAQQAGWKVVDFQEPALSTADWAPFIAESQSKGVQALSPPTGASASYFTAMSTAGYKPTFILLSEGVPDQLGGVSSSSARIPPSSVPTYFPVSAWPFELASQSAGVMQLISMMKTYAKGAPIDTDDEFGIDAWLLWAKAASACGANLTATCVLNNAATVQNWSGGETSAPVQQMALSNENPTISDCFALMQIQGTTYVYDRADTAPNNQIWHCDPKTVYHVSSS